MPTKNVYITNQLRQQMSLIQANWSEIAAQAWEEHIQKCQGDYKSLLSSGNINWTQRKHHEQERNVQTG